MYVEKLLIASNNNGSSTPKRPSQFELMPKGTSTGTFDGASASAFASKYGLRLNVSAYASLTSIQQLGEGKGKKREGKRMQIQMRKRRKERRKESTCARS